VLVEQEKVRLVVVVVVVVEGKRNLKEQEVEEAKKTNIVILKVENHRVIGLVEDYRYA
jgi:hypothetical protein